VTPYYKLRAYDTCKVKLDAFKVFIFVFLNPEEECLLRFLELLLIELIHDVIIPLISDADFK
jgi:hypothetical protein